MTQDDTLRALESLPADMRERALARLKEEGEKLRVLKTLIGDGLSDAAAGDVTDWSPTRLLAELDDAERSNPRTAWAK